MRATLLASATATSFGGLRWSNKVARIAWKMMMTGEPYKSRSAAPAFGERGVRPHPGTGHKIHATVPS